VFASTAFVPLASMPGWLQAWAKVNPVSVVVDGVRSLVLNERVAELAQGGTRSTHLLQAFAWIGGILVVFVPLAVRRYRRTT
jgi:ABC-2 type transport system permease protein/oleandomycin transport system permease protein